MNTSASPVFMDGRVKPDHDGEKVVRERIIAHPTLLILRCERQRASKDVRPSPQAGRRARRAWAMVPSSSQSNSPPTGTPRASMEMVTPQGARRSAR
jgi:hypothetical protein